MRREWGWVLGGLLAGTAVAADQGPDPSSGAASADAAVSNPSAQIEASMFVTGTLSVDATGETTGFTLDKRGKLPPPVTQLLDQMLPTFRFKPVEHDGHPVAVEATMCVEVVANQIDPKHIALRLRSARFVEAETPETDLRDWCAKRHVDRQQGRPPGGAHDQDQMDAGNRVCGEVYRYPGYLEP